MMGKRHNTVSAIVALAAALAAAPLSALPDEKDSWIRVDTTHFTLFGNVARHRTTKIGRNLERLRDVLAHTSVGMTLHSPVPTRIFVFKDEESFAPYNIGDADWSGYFIAARGGNYVVVDASAGARPFGVIYHEYLHYFLRNNLPNIPLWLNEGLAEFYSNFEVRGGRAEIGRPIDRHLFWLARHELIPLRELFALNTNSNDYNEGTRQGTVYAQSWALTHYLLTNPEWRQSMGKFLALLNTSVDAAEAFESVFGKNLPEIERDLATYVRQRSFNFYRYTPEQEIDTGLVRLRRLEHQEVLYRLGDLLAHHPDDRLEAAEEHLRAALDLEGAGSRVYSALALIRLRQERPHEALEFSRKAVGLDEDDASAHSVHGRALTKLYMLHDRTPWLLDARVHFRKCMDLAPDDMETLIDLGKTFLFGHGDPSEGIEALSRAAGELPARMDILLELIALTAHTGDTAGARQLLEMALRPRADEAITRAAEITITEVEIRRAMRLLHDGHWEQAEALMRQVAEQTHDPQIKLTLLTRLVNWSTEVASARSIEMFNDAVDNARHGEMEMAASMLEDLLESVKQPDLRAAAETHLKEIRRTLGHNRLVQRFNEAVRYANRGDLDEATSILEAMLESQPGEELRKQAEELLYELRLSAGTHEK